MRLEAGRRAPGSVQGGELIRDAANAGLSRYYKRMGGNFNFSGGGFAREGGLPRVFSRTVFYGIWLVFKVLGKPCPEAGMRGRRAAIRTFFGDFRTNLKNRLDNIRIAGKNGRDCCFLS